MTDANGIVLLIIPNIWVVAAIFLGVSAYLVVGVVAATFEWKRFQPAFALLVFGLLISLFYFFLALDWQSTIAFFLWATVAPALGTFLLGVGGSALGALWKRLRVGGSALGALWKWLGGE